MRVTAAQHRLEPTRCCPVRSWRHGARLKRKRWPDDNLID